MLLFPAPIWNLNCTFPAVALVEAVPENKLRLFHVACKVSRVICLAIAASSALIDVRSAVPSESSDPWVAFVFICVRISTILLKCPSATDIKFLAEPMLLSACPKPAALDSNFLAMEKPAASSAALLIRLPVASRSWAVAILVPILFNDFRAFNALMLVLILVLIVKSPYLECVY